MFDLVSSYDLAYVNKREMCMWLQTIYGNFWINQHEEDRSAGMVRLKSWNFEELTALTQKFIPEAQIDDDGDAEAPEYSVRAPNGVIAAAIAQVVSSVYYHELSEEVERLKGEKAYNLLSGIGDYVYLRPVVDEAPGQQYGPDSESELVLSIGAEGGAVEIHTYQQNGKRRYVVSRDENYSDLLDEEDASFSSRTDCETWHQAIAALPPLWHRLFPLSVLQEYWPALCVELRMRGVEANTDTNWQHALSRKK